MFKFIDRLLNPLSKSQQYAIKHNFEIVKSLDIYYLIYEGDLIGEFKTEFSAITFINSKKFTKQTLCFQHKRT